jgi:hypothetical protein
VKIQSDPRHINTALPLWRAARQAELRALPLPARRIANKYGIDATAARLVVLLAGLDDGGRHD